VAKAAATASVIMAKKIAFTRRLASPTTSDSSSDTSSAQPMPTASAAQPGSMWLLAIATP